MVKLHFHSLLLVICQLHIYKITSFNLGYHSESILMVIVISNSVKMQAQQHIFVVPSVTSLGILGPRKLAGNLSHQDLKYG